MKHRFLLVPAMISSLMMINAYADPATTPPTRETGTANAPISAAENKPTSAPLAQQIATTINPTTEAQPVPASTVIHATLNLKQEGQRLYAYVIIDQPQNTNGKILIDWTPPVHSSCDKSSYSLSYQGKKFHTNAYRTLGYGLISGKSITCTGLWHATIKNERGVLLTTASINIESVDAYANNNDKMRSLAAIA